MNNGELAAAKRFFGKTRIYDSIAPEFATYETIKELANNLQIKNREWPYLRLFDFLFSR